MPPLGGNLDKVIGLYAYKSRAHSSQQLSESGLRGVNTERWMNLTEQMEPVLARRADCDHLIIFSQRSEGGAGLTAGYI